MRQFREKEPKSAVPISTPGSIKSQFRDSLRRHEQCSGNTYRLPALASKVLVAVGSRFMGTRIANRIFFTFRVISWAAFIIGIGLIASVIVAHIYSRFALQTEVLVCNCHL